MRTITAGLFITLDGVVESPQKWHFPYITEEVMRAVAAQTESADTLLMGRRTYEEWASYWPHQPHDVPFASAINTMTKLVVSSTLHAVDWQNSHLVTQDTATAAAALRAGQGGNIAVAGSPSLVAYLLGKGLLDELNLLVHPLTLGNGLRLFSESTSTVPLKLVRSTAFQNGVLDLSYRPADSRTECGFVGEQR